MTVTWHKLHECFSGQPAIRTIEFSHGRGSNADLANRDCWRLETKRPSQRAAARGQRSSSSSAVRRVCASASGRTNSHGPYPWSWGWPSSVRVGSAARADAVSPARAFPLSEDASEKQNPQLRSRIFYNRGDLRQLAIDRRLHTVKSRGTFRGFHAAIADSSEDGRGRGLLDAGVSRVLANAVPRGDPGLAGGAIRGRCAGRSGCGGDLP